MSYDCDICAEIVPCPYCGIRAACTCRWDTDHEDQLDCLLCDGESNCPDCDSFF